jgi:hypothetical protein
MVYKASPYGHLREREREREREDERGERVPNSSTWFSFSNVKKL